MPRGRSPFGGNRNPAKAGFLAVNGCCCEQSRCCAGGDSNGRQPLTLCTGCGPRTRRAPGDQGQGGVRRGSGCAGRLAGTASPDGGRVGTGWCRRGGPPSPPPVAPSGMRGTPDKHLHGAGEPVLPAAAQHCCGRPRAACPVQGAAADEAGLLGLRPAPPSGVAGCKDGSGAHSGGDSGLAKAGLYVMCGNRRAIGRPPRSGRVGVARRWLSILQTACFGLTYCYCIPGTRLQTQHFEHACRRSRLAASFVARDRRGVGHNEASQQRS
jgi:hypothetical protein